MTISSADKAAVVSQAKSLLSEPGASQRTVAAKLGVGQSTLCEWLRAEGIDASGKLQGGPQPHGIDLQGDRDASITSKPLADPKGITPDELLKKHGLDPEDWIVTSIRVSEWGREDEPMFQLRVNATRRDGLMAIPELGDFKPFAYGAPQHGSRQVAFIPDLHAPYHDKAALRAVCSLLADRQPEQVIFLGDVADFSVLSRHRTHPRFAADVNTTNQAVVDNFRQVREAAPNAQIIFLPGNHDDRLLYAVQDSVPELSRVTRGTLPSDADATPEPLGFDSLWRLPELGIELVNEDWKLAHYSVTSELDARHGYLTGNNSERKLLEKHGRSQVHGHTHRGTLTYRTKHDPLDVRVAMDCGTLSEVRRDGIGYEPAPDWTPGCGWGHVWEDGLFQLSFLPFVKNKLLAPWGAAYEGKG